MNYSSFSDREILDVYQSMIGYSGKAEEDILVEITARGGLNLINQNEEERLKNPREVHRIQQEVEILIRQRLDDTQIRERITSRILDSFELDAAINSAITVAKSNLKDSKISSRTIIGSLIGMTIATCIGVGIIWLSMVQTNDVNAVAQISTFPIAYGIIYLFTRQSENNLVVFLASFLSACLSIVIGLILFRNHIA